MVVSCSECNRSYKNKNSLKSHRNNYHKSDRFENYPKKMTDANKEESSDSNTNDKETTNEEVSDQYTSSNESSISKDSKGHYQMQKVVKRKSQRAENIFDTSSDSDESIIVKKSKKLKKRCREDESSDESLHGRKRHKVNCKKSGCLKDSKGYSSVDEECVSYELERHTRFIQTIFQLILDGSIPLPLESRHVSQLKYDREFIREVAYCDIYSAERTLRNGGITTQSVLKTISKTVMPDYFDKLWSIYNY